MSPLFESIAKYWHFNQSELCIVGTTGVRSEQWSKTLQLLLSANDAVLSPSHWEYKSLAERAAELACREEIERPQPSDRKINLALQMTERIGWHLRDTLNFLSEGLRFYMKEGNRFREGTPDDPDWSYVQLLAERGDFDGLHDVSVPPWAESLYIEFENERCWQAIWCDLPSTTAPDYHFVRSMRIKSLEWLCSRSHPGSTTQSELTAAGYPDELHAAIEAFNAVHGDASATSGRTPKQALLKWLEQNTKLGKDARDRVAMVANWQRQGGAPKTPGA